MLSQVPLGWGYLSPLCWLRANLYFAGFMKAISHIHYQLKPKTGGTKDRYYGNNKLGDEMFMIVVSAKKKNTL